MEKKSQSKAACGTQDNQKSFQFFFESNGYIPNSNAEILFSKHYNTAVELLAEPKTA